MEKLLFSSEYFCAIPNELFRTNKINCALFLFSIPKVTAPAENPSERSLRSPVYCFKPCPDNQISSLATTEDYLIIGTAGEILGYDWDTILKQRKPYLAWSISVPPSKYIIEIKLFSRKFS
jgi:hypothetical protein